MEGTVLEGMTPRSKAGARRQTDNQHTVDMKVQETEKKRGGISEKLPRGPCSDESDVVERMPCVRSTAKLFRNHPIQHCYSNFSFFTILTF